MEHECDTSRQRDVGGVNRFASFQVFQIHFDEVRQILRQALDFNFAQHVVNHGSGELHRRRNFLIHKVNRYFHVDWLVRFNALEVDVLDQLLERVILHVAQEHLAFGAAQRHGQDRAVEVLFLEGVPQGVVIEFDHFGFGFAAIDDARHFGRKTQAAARTTAQR